MTTKTKQCDSGEKIPLNQWCNGLPQCKDGSDESDRHCKGESDYSVPLWLMGFFLAGLAGVGPTLFCFFKKIKRRQRMDEQESPAINPIVSKHMNEDITKVFLTKRDFDQDLSEAEEMILQRHYLNMRDQGIEWCYFSLLKMSADPPTSEKSILFVYKLEEEYLNCQPGNSYVVRKHWAQSMSHNLELKAWVFSHVSQGFGYKTGRFFYKNCLPLHSTYQYFDSRILSNMFTMYKLTVAFIDLWKDFIIAIALMNFSNHKLVSTAKLNNI